MLEFKISRKSLKLLRFNQSLLFNPATYIPLIFAGVSFPQMFIPPYRETQVFDTQSVNTSVALIGYFLCAAASLLKLIRTKSLGQYFSSADIFFSLFFMSLMASAIANGIATSIFNSFLIFAIFFSFRIASHQKNFIQIIIVSSGVCVAYLLACQVILGPPSGRWLGGIHPNIYGAGIVAALCLSIFASLRVFTIVFFICIICALMVSSRYAIITSVIIFLAFYLLNFRICGKIQHTLCFASLLFLIADTTYFGADGLIGSALSLNTSDRGLNSGLTGRDEHWAYFWPQLLERPLFGYGFRNREGYIGPHNGVLASILEAGIIGSFILYSFIFFRVAALFKEYRRSHRAAFSGRLIAIVFGVIFAVNLQPQLINFGDPLGVVILLLLFYRSGLERETICQKIRRGPV